mmetsp:Transcript_63265/g.176024  ORF Transcript_63265/g.176024 Transcript_63265/m.176024 type:complete len:303 (-) Transcript_63265:1679-2587(-)
MGDDDAVTSYVHQANGCLSVGRQRPAAAPLAGYGGVNDPKLFVFTDAEGSVLPVTVAAPHAGTALMAAGDTERAGATSKRWRSPPRSAKSGAAKVARISGAVGLQRGREPARLSALRLAATVDRETVVLLATGAAEGAVATSEAIPETWISAATGAPLALETVGPSTLLPIGAGRMAAATSARPKSSLRGVTSQEPLVASAAGILLADDPVGASTLPSTRATEGTATSARPRSLPQGAASEGTLFARLSALPGTPLARGPAGLSALLPFGASLLVSTRVVDAARRRSSPRGATSEATSVVCL